jgi:hypothetical protein
MVGAGRDISQHKLLFGFSSGFLGFRNLPASAPPRGGIFGRLRTAESICGPTKNRKKIRQFVNGALDLGPPRYSPREPREANPSACSFLLRGKLDSLFTLQVKKSRGGRYLDARINFPCRSNFAGAGFKPAPAILGMFGNFRVTRGMPEHRTSGMRRRAGHAARQDPKISKQDLLYNDKGGHKARPCGLTCYGEAIRHSADQSVRLVIWMR